MRPYCWVWVNTGDIILLGLRDYQDEKVGSCNMPILVYRFPRRTPTLCSQLCMGIQPDTRSVGNSVWTFHLGDEPKSAYSKPLFNAPGCTA